MSNKLKDFRFIFDIAIQKTWKNSSTKRYLLNHYTNPINKNGAVVIVFYLTFHGM